METYLNWLLQDPAADGAYKVFINIPLKPCYIIPHCSSPTPEPCGGKKTAGEEQPGIPRRPDGTHNAPVPKSLPSPPSAADPAVAGARGPALLRRTPVPTRCWRHVSPTRLISDPTAASPLVGLRFCAALLGVQRGRQRRGSTKDGHGAGHGAGLSRGDRGALGTVALPAPACPAQASSSPPPPAVFPPGRADAAQSRA